MRIVWAIIFLVCNVKWGQAQQELFHPSALPNNSEYGGGVSVVDLNNDQRPDVVFAPEFGYLDVYINQYPTWELIHLFEIPSETKQCLFADYDNDGDQDLAISFIHGSLKLYRNEGNLQFVDVSDLIDPAVSFIQSVFGITWGDIDNDGWLDLYCSSYSYNPQAYSFLLHNDQGSFFSDYSYLYDMPSTGRLVTQSLIIDLNNDGLQDIWEANDRSPQDRMFIQYNGAWVNYSPEDAGVYNLCAMSLSPHDFDHDGDLDVYVSNDPVGNRMFVQSDQNSSYCPVCPQFIEQASAWGLSVNKMCWGATWIDWNNDMEEDLFVATSETLPAETADDLLVKTEQGYQSTNPSWLHDFPLKTYSAARGDLNGDHKDDLVLSHAGNTENEMVINPNSGGNWLSIILTGTQSNRDAIGTKVSVFVGGKNYSKWMMCGQDYLSQHSRELIYQLGEYERVDSIFIKWPSGLLEVIWNTPANSKLHLVEGQSSRYHWVDQSMQICPGDSIVQPIAGVDFYWNDQTISQDFFIPNEEGIVFGRFLFNNQWIFTDTISLTLFEVPSIAIAVENPTCFGENNGALSFPENMEELWSSWHWEENGLNSISGLTAGEYAYSAETVDGCSIQGSSLVMDPDPLLCDVVIQDSAITIMAMGGSGQYSFYLNGIEVLENTIQGIQEGDYIIEVVDQNNCACASVVNIDYPNNLSELIGQTWLKRGEGEWMLNFGSTKSVLYDSRGKLVLPWAMRSYVNLTGSPNGIYLLVFFNQQGGISSQRIFR